MAIQKIEVDTSRLSSDIQELRAGLRDTRSQVQRLKEKMDAMNAMWEGSANAVLRQRFQVDYENMTSFCDFIAELIEVLDTMRNAYDICENSVSSAVNALSID